MFQNYDEFDEDWHISTAETTYYHYKGFPELLSIYPTKDTFKDFTQLASKSIYMPLKRYFKSWFFNMNFPRLTREYSINTFPSYTKGIGWHWCDQVFFRNKSFFGTVYGMSKTPLIWVDISTFPDKHSHGGYSAYEVDFGTIPLWFHLKPTLMRFPDRP